MTIDEQADGWHVCFMHCIARHAPLPRPRASGRAGLGAWIGRLLDRKSTLLDPERFHFYQHTPPAEGMREAFERVVLRFEEGEFREPKWRRYPVIPCAIESARFDCAQDAAHANGSGLTAISSRHVGHEAPQVT